MAVHYTCDICGVNCGRVYDSISLSKGSFDRNGELIHTAVTWMVCKVCFKSIREYLEQNLPAPMKSEER